MPHYSKLLLAFLLLIIVAPSPTKAQEHPPQLLYRKDDLLYLADAATGETSSLPNVKANGFSRWFWSPNGRYLLGLLRERGYSALRVYDIEQEQYLNDAYIEAPAYALNSATWSPDSQMISYSINNQFYGELWLLELNTGERSLLYRSPKSDIGSAVYGQWWSPSGSQLLFEDSQQIIGGSINNLRLINRFGGEAIYLHGEYYAFYDPVWSSDGNWILLTLYDTYFAGYGFKSSERGDVYVYNAKEAKSYRVTYTPYIPENQLSWSPDNREIQFTSQNRVYTVALENILNDASLEIPMRSEYFSQTFPFAHYEFPTPSPDRSLFLYLDKRFNIFVTDTNFCCPRRIDRVAILADLIGWRP